MFNTSVSPPMLTSIRQVKNETSTRSIPDKGLASWSSRQGGGLITWSFDTGRRWSLLSMTPRMGKVVLT